MKNNDFDFIKEKFDNAQPNISDNLSKDVLKQRILSNDRHKIIRFRQRKNKFRSIATVAACLVLILGIVFAANSDMLSSDRIVGFSTYDELNSRITGLSKEPSAVDIGSGIFNSVLQINEDGVETPDVVKTDGEYIYYAYYDANNSTNRNRVVIYKISGAKSELISIIDNLAPDTDSEYSDSYEIINLFVYNNRLIVFISKSNPMSALTYKRDFNATIIKIFDVTNKSEPSLITEIEQSGEYNQARMIDNILYVTSNYNVETNDEDYTIPYIKQNDETKYVSSKDTVCFENAQIAQYTVISTIDTQTGELSKKSKAVLGGSANIHCTKDYMYINEYIDGERYGDPKRNVAIAMKLNLKNSKFTYASEDEVNQYSNNIVDIGKGEMFSSTIYPVGDFLICVGENMDNSENELILLDNNLKELDSIKLENTYVNNSLSMNEEKEIFALPAYFTDSTRKYGVITFEIKNNRIVITNELKNDDDNLMYQGKCIIIGDYVYSFDINDYEPDSEKLKVFSYKIK